MIKTKANFSSSFQLFHDICAQLFEAPATVSTRITKRDPHLNLLKVFGERFARADGAWRRGLLFNFRHVFISLLDLSNLMFFIEAADEVQIVRVIQGCSGFRKDHILKCDPLF